MSNDVQMQKLVSAFGDELADRQGILECFCDQESRIEGWLKGELLYFLDRAKKSGQLHDIGLRDFRREYKIGKRKGSMSFDLRLTDNGGSDIWIELKHWLAGQQNGSKRFPGSYLTISGRDGILEDVQKLETREGRKYILVLSTSNPREFAWRDGPNSWLNGVRDFNRKFYPNRISYPIDSLTNPRDFPSTFFLGLISVNGDSNKDIVVCQHCGKINDQKDRFCDYCHHSVKGMFD